MNEVNPAGCVGVRTLVPRLRLGTRNELAPRLCLAHRPRQSLSAVRSQAEPGNDVGPDLRAKGYLPAKYEDIKSGMVAKLYLAAPRDADGKAKPTVRRIDLLAAGAGTLQPEAAPRKKKN